MYIFIFYIYSTIGDIIDGLGNLLNHYHTVGKTGGCISAVSYTEQHPLRWALTRQFNSFFWYIGEIIGDWYPLLRTKAVARDKRLLVYVYCACILYNLSKISVPISQLFLNPTKLYDNKGVYNKDYVDEYYNYYSCILVVINATSLIYDITVFLVLKRELFNKKVSEFGFIKKFRTISEYRIIISAIIGVIGLPFTLATAIAKVVLYNNGLKDLNFSIEDFRTVVNNVQYMIIFIDQILLIHSKNGSSSETYGDTSKKSNNSSSNYYNSNTFSNNINSNNFKSSNYGSSNINSSNYLTSNYNSSNYNSIIRNGKNNYSNLYNSNTNDSRKFLYYDDHGAGLNEKIKSTKYGIPNNDNCNVEFYHNNYNNNNNNYNSNYYLRNISNEEHYHKNN